ncbi:hypothetical protein QBC47DRAFT_387182 [Echria macrotheca]|uniref:C2H2-type domain-containing protein n=1 Tax=Echria macrotheca TaxID=438768 RepID=A0AAJ0F3S6_9PEZI|nr:hypothetical protein QBC47DRAFT_387182 [Echria macrotheca]
MGTGEMEVEWPASDYLEPEGSFTLRFACPFVKRDPALHVKLGCHGPGWTSVHQVRMHIFRRHLMRLTCNRCFESFASPQDLMNHQRSNVPCEMDYTGPTNFINSEAKDLLRSLPLSGGSPVDKWQEMYSIIFPGEVVPTPFYDDGSMPVQQSFKPHSGPQKPTQQAQGLGFVSLDTEFVTNTQKMQPETENSMTTDDPLSPGGPFFDFRLYYSGNPRDDDLDSWTSSIQVSASWLDDDNPGYSTDEKGLGLVDDDAPLSQHAKLNPGSYPGYSVLRWPDSRQDHAHANDDSGYGSLAAKSVALGSLDTVQEPEEAAVETMLPSADEDNRTLFSGATSLLQNADVDKYILAFANELASWIPPEFVTSNPVEVEQDLDSLLKAFAIRLGYESRGHLERQLMYLVYRFRSEIIKCLNSKVLSQIQGISDLESDAGSCESRQPFDPNPGMGLQEKMNLMWHRESNTIDLDDSGSDQEVDPNGLDFLGGLNDDDSDFDDFEIPEAAKYREVLTEATAYQWLRSTLKATSLLQVPDAHGEFDYRRTIREPIIQAAGGAGGGPRKLSRKQIQELHMHITVDWDPRSFSQEQQYEFPLSRVLAQSITLTGCGNNLQAATCEEYLQQTWPETGRPLLALLQKCADNGSNPCDVALQDKTWLKACFTNGKLAIDVVGNAFSVAEIAEQVAWMSAALRSSPDDKAAAYCTAHLAELHVTNSPTMAHHGSVAVYTGFCTIEFKMELLQDADLAVSGRCWRGIFGNPVIVRGYPILSRAEADTGLEIPLDMVAGLTKCQRIVNFAGTTYLKGFAAMLAAVQVVGNTVLWHLCYNPDGAYISYEDDRIQRPDNPHTLFLGEMKSSRHIVGWTNSVKNAVGAPDANYNIEWTGLPSPSSTHVLEKVSLSGSPPFITPGVSFVIGVKDKPLHLGFGSDGDYMGNLITIGKRYFVLYDAEERRAWLIDGVSAVLHLLRAYLQFYKEDDRVGEYFVFDSQNIEEARSDRAYTGAKAAYDVLTNPKNQNLPLYRKQSVVSEERIAKSVEKLEVEDTATIRTTASHFTLGERVEQICHVLLQSTAYYDDLNSKSGYGWRFRSSPKHQIEGFEFMDIATRNDSLGPKVATVQAMSVGWVHLVRSLRAVPLFGVGFGELFQPIARQGSPHGCCRATASVPIGKDFLAVYGADLEDMLRTGGSRRRNPWRLAGNVHWHSPDGIGFEKCRCHAFDEHQADQPTTPLPQPAEPLSQQTDEAVIETDLTQPKPRKRKGLKGLLSMFGQDSKRADSDHRSSENSPAHVAQVLIPATFPQLYGRGLRSPPKIVSTGAVIFGHCWKFPLRWSLTGDAPPTEGGPDAEPDDVATLLSDSGLGTSTGGEEASSLDANSQSPATATPATETPVTTPPSSCEHLSRQRRSREPDSVDVSSTARSGLSSWGPGASKQAGKRAREHDGDDDQYGFGLARKIKRLRGGN